MIRQKELSPRRARSLNLDRDQMLAVLNTLPDPVFVLTESGLYAGVFGVSDSHYYHDGHELVGRRIQDVLPDDVADWVDEHVQESLRKHALVKVEYQLSAEQVKGLKDEAGPDGMIWFEGHVQPFAQLIEGERAVIWVARNITARKQLEEELLQASQTDPLTHAANRRRLLEVLQHHFAAFRRYRHPMAVIMFDIDHFKQFNDRLGHLAGDEVLRCLSEICRGAIRENDLLARFGGEEFIIVLPSTTAERAVQTAERIRTTLATEIPLRLNEAMGVTVSLGVSELLESDSSHEDVLQRVDEAMYSAKERGRNRVVKHQS